MAQPHFLQTCCFVDFPMNADAISDLILAVVAFSIAFVQLRQRPALAIGCGLIGLAAHRVEHLRTQFIAHKKQE